MIAPLFCSGVFTWYRKSAAAEVRQGAREMRLSEMHGRYTEDARPMRAAEYVAGAWQIHGRCGRRFG